MDLKNNSNIKKKEMEKDVIEIIKEGREEGRE